MELLRNQQTRTFRPILSGCMFFLVLCIYSFPSKACNLSQMSLDSVVCEAGNYRIYLNLCLGGGILGATKGADNDTRTIAFGFYTSAPSMSVLNFTPSTITGDSSGVTMAGSDIGAVPSAPFGTQATIAYLDLGSPNGFMCTSTTGACGAPHSQCIQYSFLVDVLPDSIRLFGAEGNGLSTGGCYLNSDMLVTGMAPQADAGLDTLICRGDTLSLGGAPTLLAGPTNYGYTWSPSGTVDNSSLANPLAWPQSTTTYTVAIGSQSSCAATATDDITVTVDTACVWPGDCNYDLTANYIDLLSIGLAYNFIGPIRPLSGTGWFAHAAFDWSGSFLNGPNHKHADSNGDGIVNNTDILAILDNYGLTHTGNRFHAAHGSGIYFQALADTIVAGDTLWIVAGLGTATDTADSVYGVGFQLFYPPALVDSGGVTVNYDSSWLGTHSVDLISVEMDMYQSGVVEVGMSRIDHVDRSGLGEICRIGIAMQDDISGKIESYISEYAQLQFAGAVMTSANGERQTLGGELDSVLVIQNSLLPVSWDDFRGKALATQVQLNWSTLEESNADHFQIERARPGAAFEAIGSLPATGNTTERQQYEFFDSAPLAGENFYRIAERDLDGAETHSTIVSVFFGASSDFTLSGAPTFDGNQLTFSAYSTKDQRVQFQLFDLQGHELINQPIQLAAGSQTVQHRCETLSSGIYLIRLKTASTQITEKLIHH